VKVLNSKHGFSEMIFDGNLSQLRAFLGTFDGDKRDIIKNITHLSGFRSLCMIP